MTNQEINPSSIALFNLGFRPFFLAASLHAVLIMLVWVFIYSFNYRFPLNGISLFHWHAHEMIYGYSMAVIAGFLLTAVKNWTGIQTVHGWALAGLLLLWLIPRVFFIVAPEVIGFAGIFDILFMLCLILAVALPIIKAKNWRQLGILSKLILLTLFNLCFYLGCVGYLEQGLFLGVYGGLYLVIGIILTIGSRVIPFFIERGVGYEVKLYNPMWPIFLGLLVFLMFFISELFFQNEFVSGVAAAGLFIIYSYRLAGWYTSGLWRKPLLWGLYLAILFIVLGFLLFALSCFGYVSKFIAIHAFAYGGIGMITLAMMSRVSWGHTGRNINKPPATLLYMLLLILLGAVARVFLPMLFPSGYLTWIIVSQGFWIGAFIIFIISFSPVLIRSRIDGKFG